MNRARLRIRQLRTDVRHAVGEWRLRLRGAPVGPRAVLLVLGCQRSGTTLVTDLLDRDPAVKVYPEHSSTSAGDRRHGLRLLPVADLAARLAASRYPLVVLKPLVESQNTPALLDGLPRARGLWVFRHYADVARSNLARFGEGNGIKNLRSIALSAGDWRSERVSANVRRVVAERFSEAMNPWDAAALFWWTRNALFFELALHRRSDVRTCRYEELVADPPRVLRGIYELTGCRFPGPRSFAGVSASSVGRGRGIPVSEDVARLCQDMLAHLEKAHTGDGSCE